MKIFPTLSIISAAFASDNSTVSNSRSARASKAEIVAEMEDVLYLCDRRNFDKDDCARKGVEELLQIAGDYDCFVYTYPASSWGQYHAKIGDSGMTCSKSSQREVDDGAFEEWCDFCSKYCDDIRCARECLMRTGKLFCGENPAALIVSSNYIGGWTYGGAYHTSKFSKTCAAFCH
ncbi:Oidioi.mRNA.OKI2018_I69.chr2.g4045.t1.cds [Oikopleura dioica]|uniref:Oidioi.mRNA.OKI2018_I69.chr2.g4045.t1.cds n=1 Tax=Oikopleura dioica TaxID=34765 RepID=A0ABN7SZK7_OIKDI|nr:Oidioi.mRNA.OKI2018_I69.chr2.g4045.t1.cds [Oikopleura dioica]